MADLAVILLTSPRRRKFTIIALVVQLAVALVVLCRQKTEIKTNSDDEGVVEAIPSIVYLAIRHA